ncbi:MAG TPA: hypothetical protein DCG75_14180 [Bacteroidales bacterium]|jgi:cytochrome c553|nr:hypothetical protein [Bacteroidales bacterium]
MKKTFLNILWVSFLVLAVFQSCEDDEEDESHNTGQNCMSCHIAGGSGEGVFSVAGSVYDNSKESVLPNASIRLYTDANGTGNLVATLLSDKNGNFYTTETIDFGSGLYVLAEGNTTSKNMISSITSGACNSCHGVNVDRIWTE